MKRIKRLDVSFRTCALNGKIKDDVIEIFNVSAYSHEINKFNNERTMRRNNLFTPFKRKKN